MENPRELLPTLTEPPQCWVECFDCGGEGYSSETITVYEQGCGFPHDDTHERPCETCGGLGGTIDDVGVDGDECEFGQEIAA